MVHSIMKIRKASSYLARILAAKGWAVITEYELFLEFLRIYRSDSKTRKELRLRIEFPDRSKFRYAINDLTKSRFLRPDADFYGNKENQDKEISDLRTSFGGGSRTKVFRVSDVPDAPADEVSALVDPFCFVSHLSAMQHFGLSNRRPVELMLTTPNIVHWRKLRDEKMSEDYLPELSQEQYRVKLERISLPRKLRGRQLSIHTTNRLIDIRTSRNSIKRIPPIEEVFVEMLDRPDLCGGITHVIEVWKEYAPDRLDKIVAAIDLVNDGIMKVRAGFILDECLKLNHPAINGWLKFAQRGGSRKLDPSRPYAPRFSEKWMISINVNSEFIPNAP